MDTTRRALLQSTAVALSTVAINLPALPAQSPTDPLPSWTEADVKKRLLDFVRRTTDEGSGEFVPVSERVAVFDNDGTLWCEQPLYTQAYFVIDRVRGLAARRPEWKEKEPFASLLKGDLKSVAATGEAGVAELMAATHAGMSTDEFSEIVTDWIATAKHPQTGRLFTQMVYQPMLELLSHLRAKGYKTYIVSGGGIEFMRPWTEQVYGIAPEQVIGSTGGLKFHIRDGAPSLEKLPTLVLNNDKEGKPIGIQRHIGRRPVMCFGNSDGDYEMLRWTTSGTGPRFGLLVHHTDAKREYAYDRGSPVGRLEKALDEAPKHEWHVMDMARDWRQIFAFENRDGAPP